MAREIERKFLLQDDRWRAEAEAGTEIRQGYLLAEEGRSVRVRLAGDRGTLTVKGPARGEVREEFEYAIPRADAAAMLDGLALRPLIEKVRHVVPLPDGLAFEIDEFGGRNAGLVVAEIELHHPGQAFEPPAWLGEEVTDDPRYLNANLVHSPFDTW